MVRCSFCDETLQQGTGKLYVTKEGKVLAFCSSKCDKNMLKLGRTAVKLKWTRFSQKSRKKKETK
ncbi:MAG TPA: 50S ribosomal protein L24e [Candidatus Nanoarchaeia archaeon]|nr:50S ribosomal protein L24e [Candidatus Nanoarchaeia archaeon]